MEFFMTPAMIVLVGLLLMFVGKPRKGGWQRVIGAMVLGIGVLLLVAVVVIIATMDSTGW